MTISDEQLEKLVKKIGTQTNSIDGLVAKLGQGGGVGGLSTGGTPGSTGGVNIPGMGGMTSGALAGALGKVESALGRVQYMGGAVVTVLDEIAGYGKGKYDPLQRSFGGLADISKPATETAGEVVADIDHIFQSHLGNNKDFMVERNDQQVNAAEMFFKNEKEMSDSYLRVRENLGQQHGLMLNKMTEAEATRMSMFHKGLRISNQDVSDVMERTIALTGQASNDMFLNITKYADAVSKATGVSFQEISGQIVDIITDVKRFGNVSEAEAARIAGHLNTLGLSYQGFGGMIDKFMNFDTAAESLGNLTTVFGVHFDAMEMMMLANEDQEEFLIRMREAFLDSGKAVEDMTLAEKRLASQQMGMSIQDFENFMQEDREMMDLMAETDKAKEQTGAQAFQTMTEQMTIEVKSQEEMTAYMKKKVMDPLAEEAYRVGNEFQSMKSKMMLEPRKYLPGYLEVEQTIQESMRASMGSREVYTEMNIAMLKQLQEEANLTKDDIDRIDAIIKSKTGKDGEWTGRLSSVELLELSLEFPNLADQILGVSAEITAAGGRIGADFAAEIEPKLVDGMIPSDSGEQLSKKASEALGEFLGDIQGGGVIPSDLQAQSPSPALGVPLQISILSMFDGLTTSPKNAERIKTAMFSLASAAVESLSGQFLESDNPLIQMLGGGKNVKVSVGSSGPTSQVIDELKASQTQTETLIKTSETKYTELIDAVGQKLDEVATKQKEVLDKEVTQVTQVNLDTDVLATAMKNWRGAGGTVQFEVKAS